MSDGFFEIEARGAAQGINPLFGKWHQKFEFEPVSYSNENIRRSKFRDRVRAGLNNKFVYTNLVKVVITIYLDEQKLLETPAYGDLDNFAKSILDAIKGRDGLLIDDCQVQSLDISWIDIPHGAYFEIEVHGSPDDFCQNSLRLYEMSDGSYYPLSKYIWTQSGVKDLNEKDLFFTLLVLASMTKNKKKDASYSPTGRASTIPCVSIWQVCFASFNGFSQNTCGRFWI